MPSLPERARELFSSVLLTVLSIVQALALELLWDRVHRAPFLWVGGWPALLAWSQVGVMLLGFAQVWLFYVSIVARFRWLPSTGDALWPFGIGILASGAPLCHQRTLRNRFWRSSISSEGPPQDAD